MKLEDIENLSNNDREFLKEVINTKTREFFLSQPLIESGEPDFRISSKLRDFLEIISSEEDSLFAEPKEEVVGTIAVAFGLINYAATETQQSQTDYQNSVLGILTQVVSRILEHHIITELCDLDSSAHKEAVKNILAEVRDILPEFNSKVKTSGLLDERQKEEIWKIYKDQVLPSLDLS
ncbi:MAG: hypothetical protein AB4426_00355 [Xenococcaceae cyanobacterium]